jgi:hypothetical protein
MAKGLAQYDRMVEDVARAIVRSYRAKWGNNPFWNDEDYMKTGRRYAKVALKVLMPYLRAMNKKQGGK